MTQSAQKLHFGIIGCGAIGLGLAHLLREHTCTMFVSETKYDLLAKSTISVFENDHNSMEHRQEHRKERSTIDADIRDLNTTSERFFTTLDLLILPVKHYHLTPLMAQLKHTLPKSLDLLLLQNGLGGHEIIQTSFHDNTLYLGATTDAIALQNPSKIQIHARGDLLIGNTASHRASAAIYALLNAHPKASWDDDIMTYLYKKLAVNAVINPLTAKFKCRNGEIKHHPEWLAGLKKEVLSLYQKMSEQEHFAFDIAALDKYIDDVIEITAQNYSSMYQDVVNGRQTEIEGILGILIKKAADYGLQLPMTTSLYQEISLLAPISVKRN